MLGMHCRQGTVFQTGLTAFWEQLGKSRDARMAEQWLSRACGGLGTVTVQSIGNFGDYSGWKGGYPAYERF